MIAARTVPLLALALTLTSAGCAVFQTTSADSPTGTALSWLTQWSNQPIDVAPGFDVESLRQTGREPTVAAHDLLEITVWDLYEPGQPYTFPVRVSETSTIEAPLLGELSVADLTLSQTEALIVETYKSGEYLVHPRALVRSLDPATVKVQVKGAVLRPGFVELPRSDTSVYATLISAGGLEKTAGTMVALGRRNAAHSETPVVVAKPTSPTPPRSSAPAGKPPVVHAEHRANIVETMSVDPGNPSAQTADVDGPLRTGASPILETFGPSAEHFTPLTWFDLTNPTDRERLRATRLGDGDEVIVKAASPPLRIAGVVERPGAYPLPVGRHLNVWQAVELAGGVRSRDEPLNIVLLRPAIDGQPARRWTMSVPNYDEHPAAAPLVEPGDVLQVSPPTGTKIRRAVGDLWSRT